MDKRNRFRWSCHFGLAALGLAALLVSCATQAIKPQVMEIQGPSQTRLAMVLLPWGLPAVRMQFAGHELLMGIDTGMAAAITIKPDRLADLPTTILARGKSMYDINGVRREPRYRLVADARLGDFRIGPVSVLPEERGFVPDDVDGLLGLEFLLNFNLYLDYQTHDCRFYRPGDGPDDIGGWAAITFERSVFGLMARLRYGDTPLFLNLDTGACTDAAGSMISLKDDVRFRELTGKQRRLRQGNLDLGDFGVLLLDKAAIPFDGFLGQTFFEAHAVYFDFGQHRLSFR